MKITSAGRSQQGFSLIVVLCVGSISLIWVSAMAATVLPAYQQSAISKCRLIARTCAETALDTAIADLNSNFSVVSGATSSQFDAPALNSARERQVETATTGGITTYTTVIVYNRFPGSATDGANFSTIYDASLDAQSISERSKYYRIIEARCKVGACEKRVRAALEPIFTNVNGIVFPFAGFGDKGMTVVGRSVVDSYHPGEAPDPLKDKLYGHLGSNVNTGHVGQNYYNYMMIGGNQYEFPGSGASQSAQLATLASQFNATLVSKAKWCQYFGSVYSNGSNTAHWPAQPNDFVQDATMTQLTPTEALGTHLHPDLNDGTDGQGVDNVRGLNNVYPTGHSHAGKWLPQPSDVNAPVSNGTAGVYAPAPTDGITLLNRAVETMMDYKKVTMVPAPKAPTDSTDLGAVHLSHDAKIIFRTGAAMPSGLSLGSQSTGTVVLPSGSYKLNSLVLAGSSQVVVESGNVALYVEGASTSTMLTVSKTASLNASGVASANGLKVFSGKSSDIIINGNTRAAIYAPNARIFVGSGSNESSQSNFNITNPDGSQLDLGGYGTGSTNMDFWGAVVGRETYFLANPTDANSQVRFHYDRSLTPVSFQFRVRPNGGPAPTFGPKTFTGWRAISYQEDPGDLE